MSKILHVSMYAYNDGWGYQENLLPKYQVLLGHEVMLITTTKEYKGTEIVECKESTFQSVDGFGVVRVAPVHFIFTKVTEFINYARIYDLICEFSPDLIFFHSLNCMTIFDAIKYVKHNPKCKLVVDNHLDFNNGYRPDESLKHKIMALFYRTIYKINNTYITRVYGVAPCRSAYAHEIFGVEYEKLDLLIMGADDQNIDYNARDEIRLDIRKKLNISEEDFVIVSGGKIDYNKPEILNLIEAVNGLENIKLIIYGSVADDYKEIIDKKLNPNCIYIGWIPSSVIFKYFFASDLGFFPGLHSVMWEQACACNLPCIFRKLEGMEHLWEMGNAVPMTGFDALFIRNMLKQFCKSDDYKCVLKKANSIEMNKFRYSEIAKKSLETLR